MKSLILALLLALGTTAVVGLVGLGNGNNGGKGNQGSGNQNSGNNGGGNGGAVPEIHPASAASAIALLSGGLLILRGRRRK